MSGQRFWKRWKCRAKGCDFEYVDPLGCLEVFHSCAARDGKRTALRGVGKAVAS